MRIFDLHNDFLNVIKTKKLFSKFNSFVSENVSSLVCSSFTEFNDENVAFDQMNSFLYLKEKIDSCGIASNLFLSYENLGFLNSKNIFKLLISNPVYCSLTWNYDNKLAGGCLEQSGLSSFGEKVVKTLENNKIFIDVAHLNERSFMDVAKISSLPLICSHAAFFGVCQNFRNLKDYQLKIITESGGLVGLCFVGKFLTLSKKATIDDVVKNILYFVNLFGTTKGLAIGSDFFGTSDLPQNLSNYKQFCLIYEKLLSFGFSDADIDNLFYNNAAELLLK